MAKDYIEKRNGGFYVAGKRVSLDSIVYAFLEGSREESIVEAFPVLTLEEVYGALAFYLANRAEVDASLTANEAAYEKARRVSRAENPLIYRRFEEAKKSSRP